MNEKASITNRDVSVKKDEEIEKLVYICKDIRYMGIRLIRDCDKCIKNYRNTNDILQLCNLSAEMLQKYSGYVKQYVQNVMASVNKLNNDDYLIEALQKLKSITANNCKLLDTGDTDIVYDNVLAEHEEVDKQYQPLMFNDSNIEAVAICSSDSECSDFDKETVVNFSNDSNDLSQRDVELNDDMCNMEINIENYDSTTPSANCNKENEVDINNDGLLDSDDSDTHNAGNVDNNEEPDPLPCTSILRVLLVKNENSSIEETSKSNPIEKDGTVQDPDQSNSLLSVTPNQISAYQTENITSKENCSVQNIEIGGNSLPPQDDNFNSTVENEDTGTNNDLDNYLQGDKSKQCDKNKELMQESEVCSQIEEDNSDSESSSTSDSSDRTVSDLDSQEMKEQNNLPNGLENDSENLPDHKFDSDTEIFNELKANEQDLSGSFKLDDIARDRFLNLLMEDRLKRQKCDSLEENNSEGMIQTKDERCDDNSGSELYDIVREEIVSNTLSKNSYQIKAQEAFKSLMEDEEEISGSDIDELKDDDLKSASVLNSYTEESYLISKMPYDDSTCDNIKKKFGIVKELIVNLPRYNSVSPNQEDYVGDSNRNSSLSEDSSGSVEKLCDLSTVLLGKRQMFVNRHVKAKRPKLQSDAASDSSSLWSSTSDNELCGDNDQLSPTWVSQIDDDQEAVNALLDDINNSSDDFVGSNEDSDDNSGGANSDNDERATVKSPSSVSQSTGTASDFSDKNSAKLTEQSSLWRRDPLLHGSLTSDSDTSSGGCARGKRRKARERCKKRLRLPSYSSDDSSNDSNISVLSGKSLTNVSRDNKEKDIETIEVEDSPGKKSKGRRNIRALMKDADLSLSTQQAREEEKVRIKRLQEKQSTQLNSSLSSGCYSPVNNAAALILDENDDIRVEVHEIITRKLKPHQRDGIQFMWDSCFESIVQVKNGWKGSGCILAHCMGLGKTRQALALVHTLFSNEISNTKYILIVCPLSTVNSWQSENKLVQEEFGKDETVPVYAMQGNNTVSDRLKILRKWRKCGGMLVLGYEAFGSMTNDSKLDKWEEQGLGAKEDVIKALVNPGPDLVICDEGHLLRNKQTQRNLSLSQVRTKRRIVLTGTPLQNNLLEYYCMVHFVKPNLLGTEREFKTNFVNPISNGQYEDSTSADILLMKQRTHVLHKLLDRVVQRFEDTELKQYLPKLVDQALFISLSEVQVRLYNAYLDQEENKRVERTADGNIKRSNFLVDVGILDYLCTHPYTLVVAAKARKTKIKEQDIVSDNVPDQVVPTNDWWEGLMPSDVEDDPELGTKMLIVLDVLKQANAERDKVLIFSQTHAELNTLEHFVNKQLNYKKGQDYLRMDGTTLPETRTKMCAQFNDASNETLRLFIMSTKVGGLGLTLTAANRVLIMSVNWNPSNDIQSVFRVFRFGQIKPVYVYRLIARDTMEERRYKRQVTKLAVSHRVVDKHQVRRHYNMNDFQEMYSVRPSFGETRPLPNVPEDKILAKLVQKFSFLYKWHEHQKLLANRPEEHLNEHEKNVAWEEFNKKDEVQPGLVAQPMLAPNPLSPVYTPSGGHFDHDYTRLPGLVAQAASNTDPTSASHRKPQTTYVTSQGQLDTQEQKRDVHVTAQGSDHKVEGHKTRANTGSRLHAFMKHLHRLQDEAAPPKMVNSRYQPNPYAIAQQSSSSDFRRVFQRVPGSLEKRPDPFKSYGVVLKQPNKEIAPKNHSEANAIDLTAEKTTSLPSPQSRSASNVPPEQVISLD